MALILTTDISNLTKIDSKPLKVNNGRVILNYKFMISSEVYNTGLVKYKCLSLGYSPGKDVIEIDVITSGYKNYEWSLITYDYGKFNLLKPEPIQIINTSPENMSSGLYMSHLYLGYDTGDGNSELVFCFPGNNSKYNFTTVTVDKTISEIEVLAVSKTHAKDLDV